MPLSALATDYNTTQSVSGTGNTLVGNPGDTYTSAAGNAITISSGASANLNGVNINFSRNGSNSSPIHLSGDASSLIMNGGSIDASYQGGTVVNAGAIVLFGSISDFSKTNQIAASIDNVSFKLNTEGLSGYASAIRLERNAKAVVTGGSIDITADANATGGYTGIMAYRGGQADIDSVTITGTGASIRAIQTQTNAGDPTNAYIIVKNPNVTLTSNGGSGAYADTNSTLDIVGGKFTIAGTNAGALRVNRGGIINADNLSIEVIDPNSAVLILPTMTEASNAGRNQDTAINLTGGTINSQGTIIKQRSLRQCKRWRNQ